MVSDLYGEPVTEERWRGVDEVITGFARTYPLHFGIFKKDLHENQTKYQLASGGELKTAGWRNSMALPVVYRKKTAVEIAEDPHAEDDLIEVDSLAKRLNILLPGLTARDKPGQPNKLFLEFLKRYPVFRPGEKS